MVFYFHIQYWHIVQMIFLINFWYHSVKNTFLKHEIHFKVGKTILWCRCHGTFGFQHLYSTHSAHTTAQTRATKKKHTPYINVYTQYIQFMCIITTLSTISYWIYILIKEKNELARRKVIVCDNTVIIINTSLYIHNTHTIGVLFRFWYSPFQHYNYLYCLVIKFDICLIWILLEIRSDLIDWVRMSVNVDKV